MNWWRHAVAAAAAIAITLVALEFWGDFAGAMVQAIKVSTAKSATQQADPEPPAKKAMPVTVLSAEPQDTTQTSCSEKNTCPPKIQTP